MKIRAELHLGNLSSKVFLSPRPEEKKDHLSMKLAALAMYLPQAPIVDPSSSHPALFSIQFRPDVCTLDPSGQVAVWIECGNVSIRKLDKLTRRLPFSRIVVLKANQNEAKKLRLELEEGVKKGGRVEIWAWPEGSFHEWDQSVDEKTEIFGEASEKSFNLVINQHPYAIDLLTI